MNDEVLVIYADVYVFLNFALDFLCLWITARVASRRSVGWRIVAGAAFGAAYGLWYLVSDLAVFPGLLLTVAAAGVMVAAAFGFRSARVFGKTIFVFLLTEAGMGGIIQACYAIGQRRVSAIGVLFLATLSTVALVLYGLHCRRKAEIKEMKIEVLFGSHRVNCDLLVDSGNLVTEPFSALPVVILSSKVLPEELRAPDPENSPVPLRAIPVRTQTGLGLLYGFLPDSVTLCPPFEKKKKVDAIIGIDTTCGEFGGKDGLLPSSLLG